MIGERFLASLEMTRSLDCRGVRNGESILGDSASARLAADEHRAWRRTMNIDQVRKICLGFPGATEQIQWEDDLLFKVGGKMFAMTPLEPSRLWLCLKADPEEFPELTERPGIIPAPYLARAKWIAIETADAVSPAEATALLKKSYELVVAKLPKAKRGSISVRAETRKAAKKRAGKRVRR